MAWSKRYIPWIFFLISCMSKPCWNKVLLVSMDGFRWDYIKQVDTPNFDEFAEKGTRAEYINGSFVTKTFPSHFTIATGLYAESHGIVANKMYDPEFKEIFNYTIIDSKWWDGGEPIWVTARKQGLKSAAFFWPGSETEIRGFKPNLYFTYNRTVAFKTRVDAVVQWLSSDIDLALLYFYQPDSTGHKFGPNSPEVRAKVKEMDDILGYIVEKIDKNKLWNSVNVIVISDHGMAGIDLQNRHIDLSHYIDMNAVDHIPTTGPVSNILPKEGMENEIITNLTNVPHITVYRKKNIPEHWHYREHRRILPVLLVAEEGWMIVKSYKEDDPLNRERGAHGYDNDLMSMKPIFYARGPNIKPGYQALPFNNVDIYPLVCKLLCLKPAPNNGTLDNTKHFVTQNSEACQGNKSGSNSILLFKLWSIILCFLMYREICLIL